MQILSVFKWPLIILVATLCVVFFRLRRTASRRPSFLSPDKLLESQIEELNVKIDKFNAEVTSILKSNYDAVRNIKNLESSGASNELLERRRKQWQEQEVRKQNILKKLKLLEGEVERKEKERKT